MVMEEESEIFFMFATRRPKRGEEGVEDEGGGEEACCIRLNVGSGIGYLSEGFRGDDDEAGVDREGATTGL